MEANARDLPALLLRDRNAMEFFDELPSYVQDQISGKAKMVGSIEALSTYAQSLICGG